jgi:hypothetical protein
MEEQIKQRSVLCLEKKKRERSRTYCRVNMVGLDVVKLTAVGEVSVL